MLQLLSFLIVLAVMGGSVLFVMSTIRNAGDSIVAALMGLPKSPVTISVLPRRPTRQVRPANSGFARLRAAA
jgi:hypothetical protein